MKLIKKMLYFTKEVQTEKTKNGSCITPIVHDKGFILPLGFMRVLSSEGIEFEEIEIIEEVEDPK